MSEILQKDWLVVKRSIMEVHDQISQLERLYRHGVTRECIKTVVQEHEKKFINSVRPLQHVTRTSETLGNMLHHDLMCSLSRIGSLIRYMEVKPDYSISQMRSNIRVMTYFVQYLQFSTGGELLTEDVSLLHFFERLRGYLESTFKTYDARERKVRSIVSIDIRQEMWVKMIPWLFAILLINLCRNSKQHGPATKVRITASRVRGLKDEVLVNVSDNGKGIHPRILDQIFLGGFSTGNGLGMGLQDAPHKMKAMGGSIDCLPHGGIRKGAKFQLRLRGAKEL